MPSTSAASASDAHVDAVEAGQPHVVAVQDRHQLQRVTPAGPGHPRQQRQSADAVSPASMASVSSHGGTPPPSPRNGSTSSGAERPAAAVRRGERREDPVEPSDVLAEPFGDRRRGRRRQPDAARAAACRRSTPGGRAPADGGVGRAHCAPPACLTASVSALASRPPPPTSTSSVRRQRVGEVGDERARVRRRVNRPTSRHDHDAPLGQERRRLGGVDDAAHLDVVAVELVDHQRAVAVTDELVHELADRRRAGSTRRRR